MALRELTLELIPKDKIKEDMVGDKKTISWSKNVCQLKVR